MPMTGSVPAAAAAAPAAAGAGAGAPFPSCRALTATHNGYIIHHARATGGECPLKVHVDMDMCQSHGECAFVAPEVFELGDDDVLRWDPEPDGALSDKVDQAINNCPVQAISRSD